MQNEAQTYANRVVPDARGRAAQILQVAEGYKQQAVAEAKGQSARFLKVYDEYKKAPDVTRERIYLETMERILGGSQKLVYDGGSSTSAQFIDTVISIDKRILDLENPSQEVIASDQKRLVVDAFARYRIKNALRFYQSVGSIQAANLQLTTLLNAALRRVLGEVTFIQVVRDEREALMARIREQLDHEADGYGIQVVDVRIRRADLP